MTRTQPFVLSMVGIILEPVAKVSLYLPGHKSRPMPVGYLSLEIQIPGCQSLKDKRSRIKPLLARLHREFNISAAEMEHLDSWQAASIACAVVSNDAAQATRVLQEVLRWIEHHWPDIEVVDDQITVLL